MDLSNFIYGLDLIGVFVFAISGVITATQKKFDVVGATVIGFVTALGGGTIRDVLIGQTPVNWMKDINYIIIVFSCIPICYIFTKLFLKLRKGVFLFDTIGIGLFTILGVEKTLSIGLNPAVAVLMGIVSAVFGGVTRDVLSGEVPLIFRKEVYASACLIGAVTYIGLQYILPYQYINMGIAIGIVSLIRILSVQYKWALPFRPLFVKD